VRILLVSSSSGSRGGGEIFLLYLGEVLKAAGHTVGLWASRHPRMDELAARFATLGDVLRLDYRNTYDRWHRGLLQRRNPAALARLRQSWLDWQPDVVHLNKQNLEDGNDLLAAAAALATPHLCTIHITQTARFLGARFPGWRDRNARHLLRDYRGLLVAVAGARATELMTFLGPEVDVRTVNNGVPSLEAVVTDRATLRAAEGLRPESVAIVAVGRLEPQKCPLRFLEYAERIRQVVPNVEFRWIGSGRLAVEWERAVSSRNLGDFVRRIEWRHDVRQVLPAFDLMLHPAAYEGLALALLEGMDAGVPCAVMPAVHAQLPPALRSCCILLDDQLDWRGLLTDPAKLAALGQTARRAIGAEFSTVAMGRAYEAIYRELCSRR
jgi:glycosyltransferase involved in cell wall biosynthesis